MVRKDMYTKEQLEFIETMYAAGVGPTSIADGLCSTYGRKNATPEAVYQQIKKRGFKRGTPPPATTQLIANPATPVTSTSPPLATLTGGPFIVTITDGNGLNVKREHVALSTALDVIAQLVTA